MEYLDELNEEQRSAVECTDGPVMVIAGAGSGKTRALTYRVAHIINKGNDPFNILALTFTNKAAKEMRERIQKIVGTESRNIWMGTFHSVFARILRSESDKLGYPSNFTIYDTQDSRNLIKTIVNELNLSDKIYKPSVVQNRISSAKSNLISAQEYMGNDQLVSEDRMNAKPKIGEIYMNYAKRCFKAGAMDFDDLLFNTNKLLRDHPDVLNKYQMRFKYIMVDEYQDTNYAQYLIVKRLAAKFENICVVGDDAQSIYAFRGANIRNILNFEKDYPDLNVFKLERNYRSTSNIVNSANAIIAQNREQIKKSVWTKNAEGDRIKLVKNATDNEEGMNVARSIFDTKMNDQAGDGAFAILYRTNAQSRAIEESLRKMNIPYRIFGGLSFYQRKEVKDLIAYIRLAINPKDEESFKRIINYPTRGLGKTTQEKILVLANQLGVSAWDVIRNKEALVTQFNAGVINKLDAFSSMLGSFSAELTSADAYDLATRIATSSGILKELYSDRTPEGVSRYDNIQELLNAIKDFAEQEPEEGEIVEEGSKTLAAFCADIALLTDADQKKGAEDIERVSLMTVHAAKGLEFPYVYIVGLEENLFPSQMAMNTRSELEEERRLFYVALTRAEKTVNLSYALSRYRWGQLTYGEPSRFIEELPHQYIDDSTMHNIPTKNVLNLQGLSNRTNFKGNRTMSNMVDTPTPKDRNLTKYQDSRVEGPVDGTEGTSDNVHKIIVGMEVIHDKFGKGEIIELEGEKPNIKATVTFLGAGNKQLLLKFAKLRIVSSGK
ncbi:MAG: DNA helicase-2/ATP-dependent DNA helicase PcrA [Bacteroidia bacterium]|jgi:DNA helicase-2/ATP-dependent DNA helicase PcrA